MSNSFTNIPSNLPPQAGHAGEVLFTDGSEASWQAVSGTGSVTSVDASGGTTGMSFSGGPITAAGTLTMGGILAISAGGTGQSNQTAALNALTNAGAATDGDILQYLGGNAQFAAYSPPPPSGGDPYNLAYYNGSGVLDNMPGWTTNGALNPGLNANLTLNPDNNGGQTLNNINLYLRPLQNSPNDSYNNFFSYVNLDPDSSGFQIGTNGSAATAFNIGFTHAGTSDVGSLTTINTYSNLGNGTDPITVGSWAGMFIFGDINDNVTITNSVQGYIFQPHFHSGAILTTSNLTAYGDFASIDGSINGYSSFNMSPQISEILNNSNYQGLNLAPVIGTMSGNAGFYGFNCNAQITTLGTNGAQFVNVNPTVVHLDQNCTGVGIFGQTTDGTANWAAIKIDSSGINTTGNVKGIEITVANDLAHFAADFTGHCNLGSQFALVSGQVQQYGHVIGGEIIVPNATSITGTDVLANNMAFTVNTGDATSTWTANSVVGITTLGFVGQIVGDGTMTGDINFCLNGYSDLHNGHIDRVNNFHAAAIPGGGAGTMDESILYYGQMPFGFVATDNWGIRIDTEGLQNYLTCLAVGDMTSKKVTNASVGIELDSVLKAVLLSRMSTTERDALTAVNGMLIYNTTLDKFQGYESGAWTNLI